MTPHPLTSLAFALILAAAVTVPKRSEAQSHLILFGTYTTGESRGIYSARLDESTGTLSSPMVAAETPNPSFLVISPDRRFVYAHTDMGKLPDGRTAGGIKAFTLDARSGRLAELNAQPTGDPFPSNVNIDATGRVVATVSGTGGYITTFHVEADGSLSPRVSHIAAYGTPGPVAGRQEHPYPHSTWFDPANRFALVCDLGSDRIFTFRFDPATAVLSPERPPFLQLPRGTGPRHAKFSSDGRFFYIVGELSNTVTACRYDAASGTLSPFQRLTTVPAGVRDSNEARPPDSTASEIRIRPDGRFLYAANRGDDSIAVFARDAESGRLTPVEIVKSGGHTPRNFALSPDGKWLVCAHQDSSNVTLFRVDPESGRLARQPSEITVPQGICVAFVN